MGYRSDVAYTIRFKTEEAYRLFILEAKAKPETAGCFRNDEAHYDEAECDDKRLRIDFRANDVKWYPSYSDVMMHTALLMQADSWCGEDEEKSLDRSGYRLGYAFVRVGEDDNDIETKYGGDSAYDWLYVSRTIEGG